MEGRRRAVTGPGVRCEAALAEKEGLRRKRWDKFTRMTATACRSTSPTSTPDKIVPAQLSQAARAAGLGEALLHDLRFDSDRARAAGLPLQPGRHGAAPGLIVGGASSAAAPRAKARVYASTDYGITMRDRRPSSAKFSAKPLQKGLLTRSFFGRGTRPRSMATRAHEPELAGSVDSEQQGRFLCGERESSYRFAHRPGLPPQQAEGLDDIAMTASYSDRLSRRSRRATAPPRGRAGAWTAVPDRSHLTTGRGGLLRQSDYSRYHDC